MYSLYPYRITGFFWWVDQHNFWFAKFVDLSVDFDLVFGGVYLLLAASDSLRSDVSASVPYSSIFIFPFSLCVNRLLDF